MLPALLHRGEKSVLNGRSHLWLPGGTLCTPPGFLRGYGSHSGYNGSRCLLLQTIVYIQAICLPQYVYTYEVPPCAEMRGMYFLHVDATTILTFPNRLVHFSFVRVVSSAVVSLGCVSDAGPELSAGHPRVFGHKSAELFISFGHDSA